MKSMRCPFAVKSGGHGCYDGQSSVGRGITIDLVRLDQITLSDDRSIVTLGPGSHWLDVYTALEPLGVTVIGGRDAGVGVGGFLLGGECPRSCAAPDGPKLTLVRWDLISVVPAWLWL